MQGKITVREYDEDPTKDDHEIHYHEYVVMEERANVNDHQSNATSSSDRKRVTTSHARLPHPSSSSSSSSSDWFRTASKVVQELFLPVGYPSSVREGYLEYQVYDSLQGLCSYLRGVLCSAQVLQAAGVGKAEAVSLSVATTWALKDGVSMIGGLLYSYRSASLFDAYVKEFRLFADIANDVGMTLDMLAPYFDNLLLVSSLAGLCKTVCGISAGATKSSITQHFALEGNMADLNAKEATQETLVSLVGMLFGVALARHLSKLDKHDNNNNESVGEGNLDLQIKLQWLIFISLTVLHVWANWVGVTVLRLRTLNQERARVTLKDIVNAICDAANNNDLNYGRTKNRNDADNSSSIQEYQIKIQQIVSNLPSPEMVRESIFSSTYRLFFPGSLQLSAKLSNILSPSSSNWKALDEFAHEKYILAIDSKRKKVQVTLLVGATTQDQLQAFIHATVLCQLCCQNNTVPPSTHNETTATHRMISNTHKLVQLLFVGTVATGSGSESSQNIMTALSKKGWEMERIYIGFTRGRVQITTTSKDD